MTFCAKRQKSLFRFLRPFSSEKGLKPRGSDWSATTGAKRSSDIAAGVVGDIGEFTVENILNGNAVEVLFGELEISLPDEEGAASLASGAAVFAVFEAGDGSEGTLCGSDDIADGTFSWNDVKPITAAISAICADKTCFAEHRDDLFEVFFGNTLPLGYFGERHEALSLIFGKVGQHSQRVSSFC